MLKTIFPDLTVVWGTPETARQLLSTAAIKNLQANPVPPPTNTVGTPGIAVFRSNVQKDYRSHSLPKASIGMQQGQFSNIQQQVSVSGQITIGDVITLHFASADIAGGTATASYTIMSDDTPETIATGLTAAITASSALATANITAVASEQIVNVYKSTTTTNTLTITNTSPSGQTEKVNIYANLAGNFEYIQYIPVRATYSITAVTKYQSDMNNVERTLWFSDIYKGISTTIQGNTFKWNFFQNNDQTYDREINKDTGIIIWYKLNKTIEVDGIWAQGYVVPAINEIQAVYEQMVDGSPITLDTVTTVIDTAMNIG